MKTAIEWTMQLPPDVLEHPMPLPARLGYAEAIIKRIQADALQHAQTVARELNDGHEWPVTRALQVEIDRISTPNPKRE